MSLWKRHTQITIPLILFLALLSLHYTHPQTLEDLRLKVFDGFQKLKPRTYGNYPVRIIDINDESLTRLGQWPWQRTQMAELISKLADAGASAIALDIVFAEPDRTSPENILPLWPQTSEKDVLRSAAEKLPSHDRVLSKALQKAPAVLGFGLTTEPHENSPELKAGFAFAGDDPVGLLPEFQGAVTNLPILEAAASGNGSFSMIAEHDGILRRLPLLFNFDKRLYPSLVLETLRVAQKASGYIVKSTKSSQEKSFGEHRGIVSIKTGSHIIPTDREGRLWIYDTGFVKERFLPAWKILEGNFREEQIRGNIVFVGTSATGLKDIRTTPLNPVAAGVEIHAQLTEQILSEQFLNRPDWAPGAELIFLAALSLLVIFVMPLAGALWCAVIGLLALGGAFFFSWHAFSAWNLLLDPVLPSMAVLLIYLSSSLIHFLRTESERRHIREAFSHYMSPALVARLAEHPNQLKLGGESKVLTLLFADIRGFTTFSEGFGAEELTRFINRFLTPMTEIILRKNGTIDKYMGDCIMAFWNAPLADSAHALHACETALLMRDYLAEWNKQIAEEVSSAGRKLPPIEIGIGINTGNCCVGNLGSEQRFDYSALGDEVNLASRLEGLCKIYGNDILAGENTVQNRVDFAWLEIDLIRVKGKTKPVRVHTLLGDLSLKNTESFARLHSRQEELLDAYRRQNWDSAEKLTGECRSLSKPEWKLDSYYNLYRERICNYRANPPGPDWNGIFSAETK